MRFLSPYSLKFCFFALSVCVQLAAAEPAFAQPKNSEGSYEVLARHEVTAVFAGTRFELCKGRTMLCPYECGGSGKVASFEILRYEAYEKLSEFGDEQAAVFEVMLEATTGKSDVSPEVKAVVEALAVGDTVHLLWEHIYHTDPKRPKEPERKVRLLEPENRGNATARMQTEPSH